MMRAIWPAAAILLALGAARSDPLAGRIAGPPANCVDADRLNAPIVTDNGTILYRQSGARIWQTKPVGACNSLAPFTTLIVERTGPQLCRGDRFRILRPQTSIPSGYCLFGPFVPYDKVTARND